MILLCAKRLCTAIYVRTLRRRTNYLKATLAKRATSGPQKETAMMTPAALNAGDRIFCVG